MRVLSYAFATKPVRILNNILEHAGMKFSEIRREMSGALRIYYYGLDREKLDVMNQSPLAGRIVQRNRLYRDPAKSDRFHNLG
jgi:hypothetical protein